MDKSAPIGAGKTKEVTENTEDAEDAQDAQEETRLRNEPRWFANLAITASAVLYSTLEDRLTIGPAWLPSLLVGVALVPLFIIVPEEYGPVAQWRRVLAFTSTGLLGALNLIALINVSFSLVYEGRHGSPALIAEAMKIWIVNVLIFALWYWELDGHGPAMRRERKSKRPLPDFLFPQMSLANNHIAPDNWAPRFLDYLYLSFTNSTAFSPTDTLPLTTSAKMLMLVQSLASLVTVALVAARAVNILPT